MGMALDSIKTREKNAKKMNLLVHSFVSVYEHKKVRRRAE